MAQLGTPGTSILHGFDGEFLQCRSEIATVCDLERARKHPDLTHHERVQQQREPGRLLKCAELHRLHALLPFSGSRQSDAVSYPLQHVTRISDSAYGRITAQLQIGNSHGTRDRAGDDRA